MMKQWFRIGISFLFLLSSPLLAQDISGVIFEDRDRDGEQDASEPSLSNVQVSLYGVSDVSGNLDQSTQTDGTGLFSFSPGDGCYLVNPQPPSGYRFSSPLLLTRSEGSAGYSAPIGLPRFGSIPEGIDRLKAGSLKYSSMGDSIAYNWNSCFDTSAFWYSRQVRDRLACVAPSATITLDEAAVKGEHTDDLLVDDTADTNNVFRQIENQPHWITISMIGNDLLGVDAGNNPTQEETNTAAEELLDSRANLQEAISSMLSEIPDLNLTINTLYDNEAYNCGGTATSDFHREWLPIINRMILDLAWGQAEPVGVQAVAEEFSREYVDGSCSGFRNKICRDFLGTDLIHPTEGGYEIIREKVWEAAGGVLLGTRDAANRSSQTETNVGLVRHLARLLPSTTESLNGASVTNPQAALDDNDGSATADITLGIGSEEFRLAGFPNYFDEYRMTGVIAGVRYDVVGDVTDDFYRIEASPTGVFRAPPGHAYSPTDWNFYTPIVGGGGPNMPASNADYANATLLVVPEPSSMRTVSATLSKNPELPPGAADYSWPDFTFSELGDVELRVAAAAVSGTSGNDAYTVRLDAGWLDLYGWELPRPAEVEGLEVRFSGTGDIEVVFDPLSVANRYNLYTGRIASLPTLDHGNSPPRAADCGPSDFDAGDGKRGILIPQADIPGDSVYFLVTAHDAESVESPSGYSSANEERDRSESVCF